MSKVMSFYKPLSNGKCVKQYVIDFEGKCIPIDFYKGNDYLKQLFNEIKYTIPNYTYESYKDYLKSKDIDVLEEESYDEFVERHKVY